MLWIVSLLTRGATMACIVHRRDPKSGSVYAYSSRSYRDPETKRVKTEKTYLGRVDPETGEIIPKATGGRRNRAPVGVRGDGAVAAAAPDPAAGDALARIGELEERVRLLESEVARLSSVAEAREGALAAVAAALDGWRGVAGKAE